MKTYLGFFFSLLCFSLFSQQNRSLLRGKLMYRNNNVIAANVVNNSAQTNTITDENGEFEIVAGLGDEIIFSSIQFKIRTVTVTTEVLEKNRLIVEVNERVNILDEIVVGPENTEKFLDLKKEEFSRVDYNQDKSTKIENNIMQKGQLNNGLNLVNIALLLAKAIQRDRGEEKRTLTPSKVLPQIFDEQFFTEDLGIPLAQLPAFLALLDDEMPSDKLLKKNKEFQLIEYLIQTSSTFNQSEK